MTTQTLIQVSPEELSRMIADSIRPMIREAVRDEIKADNGFLTRKEVMSILNVKTHNTIRKYVRAGLLKEYRNGASPKYLKSEVMQLWTR